MEDGEYRRKRDDDSGDDHEGKGSGSGNKSDNKKKSKNNTTAGVNVEKPIEELSPEEQEAKMMAMMGFGGFDSTKVKERIRSYTFILLILTRWLPLWYALLTGLFINGMIRENMFLVRT